MNLFIKYIERAYVKMVEFTYLKPCQKESLACIGKMRHIKTNECRSIFLSVTLFSKNGRSTKITETIKAVKRQGSNLCTRFSSTKTITYCKINITVKSMLLCKIDILLYSKYIVTCLWLSMQHLKQNTLIVHIFGRKKS